MFLLPNIVMIGVFTLLPLIFAFVISFQNLDSLGGWSWVGFGNYVKLVTDPVFWQSMRGKSPQPRSFCASGRCGAQEIVPMDRKSRR